MLRTLRRYMLAIVFVICLAYLMTLPGVFYWTWEVGASLALDALFYVFLPLFLIGMIVAICRNWRTVVRELFRVADDVRDVVT